MIAKSLAAAAAVVSSLVAVTPEPAKADIDFNVGVNLGHPGFHPGYGYGYGYAPVHPVFAPSRISCHQGKWTVRGSGFFNVQPIDCHGPSYRYSARRGGAFYRVTVNAFSGRIVRVRPYSVY